ncbi:MAG: hypothetical protein ACK4RW_13085, partial [Rehaibacterium terrae]|uniref:hypothetical protein n=1 Tax=Rehaibacterium terrae TaxID=1341696 RepID=UPI00391D927A
LSAMFVSVALLLHTFMMPHKVAFGNFLKVLISTFFTFLLASHFGATGAALAYGLALVVGDGYMAYRAVILYRKGFK